MDYKENENEVVPQKSIASSNRFIYYSSDFKIQLVNQLLEKKDKDE